MSSEKIMVVEDEWVVADQLCRELKDLGYTVCSTASTGYEALSKVEADRPDLILMDIVLKGRMDGIEAAERITSQLPRGNKRSQWIPLRSQCRGCLPEVIQ